MARLIKPKKPKEILIKIYKIQAFNNIYITLINYVYL